MKKLLQIILLNSVCIVSFAQTTIILQPDSVAGIDAHVVSLYPNVNFEGYPEFSTYDWTFGGNEGISRSLIKFDLSQIPVGAQIVSAYLSLYYSYNTTNAPQSGTNASYLQEITSAWTENSVTWSNQPTTTSVNQITLQTSTSNNQSYPNIDVTGFVQDGVNHPIAYYGWMLRLITETTYRCLKFGSSDNPDSTIRPKLVITYSTCITLKPDSVAGKDAHVISLFPNQNYGSYPEFSTYDWTFTGNEGISRSLIQFDLSQIPTGANIVSASLSLFYAYNTTNAPQSGTNESYLQEVTSAWNENTVTWSNQPTSTTANQITLQTSTSNNQSYTNIDVTGFVQDGVNNPTSYYGWMLRLITETTYRCMKFGSSDNPDSTIHPELAICYQVPSTIKPATDNNHILVYPNPAKDFLRFNNAGQKFSLLEISDLTGRILETHQINSTQSVIDENISFLENGIYLISFYSEAERYSTKIVVARE